MWAIIKKEFKSYFLSPIGYIVVGILLSVCSIFFYLTIVQTGSIDLSGLYYYTALYGLIIAGPILTMRMFAEERKNGTEQLILTAPISITKVVLGKLIAALGVIIIIFWLFCYCFLFCKSKYHSRSYLYVWIYFSSNSSHLCSEC